MEARLQRAADQDFLVPGATAAMTQFSIEGPAPTASDGHQGLLALESLALAARQVALYGPDHPIAASALEKACSIWAEETGGQAAELRAEEGGLLWNGQPLPHNHLPVSRLHQALRERLIACIRFDPDVQREDLAELLLFLAREPQELLDSGGAMKALSGSSGGVHIENVDFTRELRESEAAWLEKCGQVEKQVIDPLTHLFDSCAHTIRNLGEIQTLSKFRSLLDDNEEEAGGQEADSIIEAGSAQDQIAAEVAHLLQCAGEVALLAGEEYWEGWRSVMARQLSDLGEVWRAAVFRAPSGAKPGRPDMLSLIAQVMTPEECVSAVLDYPDAIQTERSRGLSRVLFRIMPNPQRKQLIDPLLHAEAVRRGISEDIYRNVVGLLSSKMEVDEETERPEGVQVGLGGEMTLLLDSGRSGNRDPALDELEDTTRPNAVIRARREMLLELLDADLAIDRYAQVLDLLTEEAKLCSQNREPEAALRIIGTLQRARKREAKKDAGKRAVTTDALVRTGTTDVVADVLAEINRADPKRWLELLSLLGDLGDEGMAALASLARQLTAHSAMALMALVSRDSASCYWLRQLLEGAATDSLPWIVRNLLSLGDPRITDQLASLANHPSVSVRLDLIQAIRETANGREVLVRLFEDSEPSVVQAAVEAAGELKVTGAVPLLCKLAEELPARGKKGPIKEAVIVALGWIGAQAAGPTLQRLLLPEGVMALLASARPMVAAAEALARIGGNLARETLKRGENSRKQAVREACRRALAGLAAAPVESATGVG